MAKSGKQTETGKAFEYACAYAIQEKYKNQLTVIMEQSAQMNTASRFYAYLSDLEKEEYVKGAAAAIKIIDRLEPRLSSLSGELILKLQTDSKGISGDVRDVVCSRDDGWEIGLSCKHNHDAVKHSRLSDRIDFAKEWFGKQCSDEYFSSVKKVFWPLRLIREESKISKTDPILWADIDDKEEKYYVPVLEAFMKELKRLDACYPGEIPKLLISYLIGKNDFYKVIMNSARRFTKIESININGTLNKADGKKRAIIDVPIMKMPTKFYEIGFKDGIKNTIVVVCDNGWNVSMRIHNASSKVEPSLKFDVTLLAMPSSILTQIEPWE